MFDEILTISVVISVSWFIAVAMKRRGPSSALIAFYYFCGFEKCSGEVCRICEPYQWPLSGEKWSEAGIFARTLANEDPNSDLVRNVLDDLLDNCIHPNRTSQLYTKTGLSAEMAHHKREKALTYWIEELKLAYTLAQSCLKSCYVSPFPLDAAESSLMIDDDEEQESQASLYRTAVLDHLRTRFPDLATALDFTPKPCPPSEQDSLLRRTMFRELSPKEKEAGFVYIIESERDHLESQTPADTRCSPVSETTILKIGYTEGDPKVRLEKIERECKIKVKRWYSHPVNCARRVERMIHACLKIKGYSVKMSPCSGCKSGHCEWFQLSFDQARGWVDGWCRWMLMEEPYDDTGKFQLFDAGKIYRNIDEFFDNNEDTHSYGSDSSDDSIAEADPEIMLDTVVLQSSVLSVQELTSSSSTQTGNPSLEAIEEARLLITPVLRRPLQSTRRFVQPADYEQDGISPPLLAHGLTPSPAHTPNSPETPTPSAVGRSSQSSYSSWNGLSLSSSQVSKSSGYFSESDELVLGSGTIGEMDEQNGIVETRQKLIPRSRVRSPLAGLSR